MDLKKLKKFIDIEDKRLKKHVVGVVDTEKRILARMVKLTEEVGELADEVLAHQGRQRKEKLDRHESGNLADEFADVIIAVFFLAKTMDINIPRALNQKIKKINQRHKKQK
jgi:NTP pyrophosphatase (non-canonical NTP hydrolase)